MQTDFVDSLLSPSDTSFLNQIGHLCPGTEDEVVGSHADLQPSDAGTHKDGGLQRAGLVDVSG